MSSPLLEAALLADRKDAAAVLSALQHEADIGTAETALSALGSAGAYVDAMAEHRRWQAVAAKLREMARRGEG